MVKALHVDLPSKFPSDAGVIAQEAAWFRSLSPQRRLASIRGLFAAGAVMVRRSSRAAYLHQYAAEQKHLYQQAVKEFLDRHAEGTGKPG